MGEYAKRKNDGAEIKVGTCEDLRYLRFDQLNEVEYNSNWLNCFFRIPNPDEDGIEPGDFRWSLLNQYGYVPAHLRVETNELYHSEVERQFFDGLRQDEGSFQLRSHFGLQVYIQCQHGLGLPSDIRATWNGKAEHLMVSFLKPTERELRVGISCAACENKWSASFDVMAPLMKSLWLKLRLLHQCSEYYMRHNEDLPPYVVCWTDKADHAMSIKPVAPDMYKVKWIWEGATCEITDTWEASRDLFISRCNDSLDTDNLKARYLREEGGVEDGTD